ncbi:hypothetical protein LINPERHAP1_LOCUS17519 [Linum perenne]
MTPATRIIVLFPPPLILPLCIEEAGVEGDHIVQPINHKFDHSLLIRNDEEKATVSNLLNLSKFPRVKILPKDTTLIS